MAPSAATIGGPPSTLASRIWVGSAVSLLPSGDPFPVVAVGATLVHAQRTKFSGCSGDRLAMGSARPGESATTAASTDVTSVAGAPVPVTPDLGNGAALAAHRVDRDRRRRRRANGEAARLIDRLQADASLVSATQFDARICGPQPSRSCRLRCC